MVVESLILLSCFLAALAAVMAFLAMRQAAAAGAPPREVLEKLALMHDAAREHPKVLRDETGRLSEAHAREAAALRDEVLKVVQGFQAALGDRFDRLGEQQTLASATLRKELTEGQGIAAREVKASTEQLGAFQRDRLLEMAQRQQTALDKVAAELAAVKQAAAADSEKQRTRLSEEMATLRKENDAKLEQMRLTVDEKLQSTLDQRLDANFKQVSDRLESVQKGLGEMQTLATGVGDLKRVLTNVRSRGTWGEVQLASLLEDSLTSEQYASQVAVRPRTAERVDFAVRLPGQDENGQVWLPIDCKFPHEDYARLVAAQEAADPLAVETMGRALERAVATQARSIADKYICAPYTTDFAYLYLPTEGLFAEIVRREGFTAELRAKYKVEVAGPSTITALLNSLRVGFRSLQIQKKSSEVWTELGKVKSAFEKYGDALQAVDDKLDEAKRKVADVSKRHGQVLKSLRDVESSDALITGTPPLLALAAQQPLDEAA